MMVTVVTTQDLKALALLLRFKDEASQDDIHGSSLFVATHVLLSPCMCRAWDFYFSLVRLHLHMHNDLCCVSSDMCYCCNCCTRKQRMLARSWSS